LAGVALVAVFILPHTWWGIYLQATYFSTVYELLLDKQGWSVQDWGWRQAALTVAALTLYLTRHL
jgi:hypothetical protein